MTTDALHTLTRHWLLLRAIPRAPRKVDTATLERHLEAEGVGIHRRSIQRDLHQLSSIFPLVCDDRSRPYGWSWARDAQVVDLPAMDPRTAMTFRLVGRYLPHLLPRSTWRVTSCRRPCWATPTSAPRASPGWRRSTSGTWRGPRPT